MSLRHPVHIWHQDFMNETYPRPTLTLFVLIHRYSLFVRRLYKYISVYSYVWRDLYFWQQD